jgi:hypothetical protein
LKGSAECAAVLTAVPSGFEGLPPIGGTGNLPPCSDHPSPPPATAPHCFGKDTRPSAAAAAASPTPGALPTRTSKERELVVWPSPERLRRVGTMVTASRPVAGRGVARFRRGALRGGTGSQRAQFTVGPVSEARQEPTAGHDKPVLIESTAEGIQQGRSPLHFTCTLADDSRFRPPTLS